MASSLSYRVQVCAFVVFGVLYRVCRALAFAAPLLNIVVLVLLVVDAVPDLFASAFVLARHRHLCAALALSTALVVAQVRALVQLATSAANRSLPITLHQTFAVAWTLLAAQLWTFASSSSSSSSASTPAPLVALVTQRTLARALAVVAFANVSATFVFAPHTAAHYRLKGI